MTQKGSPATTIDLQYDTRWQDSPWRSRLRRKLLNWFADNARTMPWRSDPQPYFVWISEIMLQQTQVATVLPYFKRFIDSFPTIDALADAEEADLMRHWEGLGYYRRARSLHAAAKKIVAEHGGEFPTTFDDVLALPGVGRYTAGAILSISAQERLPILEGNTNRVFSRWISLRQPPAQKQANELLWKVAETMLPRSEPGIFNQAAMELGALVCIPRTPKCGECPVAGMCSARRDGIETQIPGKVTKVAYEDRTEFALVIPESRTSSSNQDKSGQRYLMRPLPDQARWSGLWDFPRPTDVEFDSVAGVGDWLSDQLGRPVQTGIRLKTIRHAVTKYRISLHVHSANIDAAKKRSKLPVPWEYVSLDQMKDLPMSVTGRKICEFLKWNTQEQLDF
jgi:A/G-specific adenine glycosylase